MTGQLEDVENNIVDKASIFVHQEHDTDYLK